MGEYSTAKGAGLLFGTNVVAIVLGAALNFYVAGIRGKQGDSQLWAHRLAIALALVCVVLIAPLTSVLIGKRGSDDSMVESVEQIMLSSAGGDEYKLISATIKRQEGNESWIEIHLEGPQFPPKAMTAKLSQAVHEKYGKEMKTKIRMTLVKGVDYEK